ncbi:MAG TPA: 50S ribosomal protein L29 [Candidatus Paceibacterota bacterium]
MKKKALEQLRNKPEAELREEMKKKKDTLWDMQVDLQSGKVKNVREIRSIKQTIAIIQTVLREKQNIK